MCCKASRRQQAGSPSRTSARADSEVQWSTDTSCLCDRLYRRGCDHARLGFRIAFVFCFSRDAAAARTRRDREDAH